MKKNLANVAQRRLAFVLFVALSFALASCGRSSTARNPPASAVYKKTEAPVADRVADLLKRMTLTEKIGQMTQIEKGSLKAGDVATFFLGSVLSGGGGSPARNTAADWADMVDGFQKEAFSTRLGIPILYGVDAVHGHNNLKNATIFPHNIGLGAANDTNLVARIGAATALETAAAGIPWNFAPCVAVARDPRWGRTYESYGQDPALVSALGGAYIEGYQSPIPGLQVKTAATAKHFLGDGAAVWESARKDNFRIDQGDARGDETYLRTVLLTPYEAAIKAGVRTVMVSFSSWNGTKMHGQKELITGLLKEELAFSGLVVSDWGGIDQVASDYHAAVVAAINAGIDMNMVPYDARAFIGVMEKAVAAGEIPISRIDDAVSRILRVKFEMGLFETPLANRDLASSIRSVDHLALAREAVAKSLVVLRNDGILPLSKNMKKIYVAGNAADDLGIQCGGWTLDWQGKPGNNTEGTTILEGIREKLSGAEVVFDAYGRFDSIDGGAICVLAVGETPYAEGVGDSESIAFKPGVADIIERVTANFGTVVLVVVSGRPLVLDGPSLSAGALVAAWLPGTEGSGVTDVLFGDVPPSGKLSFDWPKSVTQLPFSRFISGEEKPLFPVGFGLSY